MKIKIRTAEEFHRDHVTLQIEGTGAEIAATVKRFIENPDGPIDTTSNYPSDLDWAAVRAERDVLREKMARYEARLMRQERLACIHEAQDDLSGRMKKHGQETARRLAELGRRLDNTLTQLKTQEALSAGLFLKIDRVRKVINSPGTAPLDRIQEILDGDDPATSE